MSSTKVTEPSAENKPVTTPAQSSDPHPDKVLPIWIDALIFWLDWTIKVLGVAAALVFGIWAPLSYQASKQANENDDTAQKSIVSVMSVANSQLSVALSSQSVLAAKQNAALNDLNKHIGAIGQLWILDFCIAQTALDACNSLTREISITSLISYLATPTPPISVSLGPTLSTSSSAGITGSPSSTPNEGRAKRPGLTLPAILGVVFAVILFLGVILGVFVSRIKKKRLRRRELEEH